MTYRHKSSLSITIAVVAGVALLFFSGRVKHGDIAALPWFFTAFIVFSISSVASYYFYHRRNDSDDKEKLAIIDAVNELRRQGGMYVKKGR